MDGPRCLSIAGPDYFRVSGRDSKMDNELRDRRVVAKFVWTWSVQYRDWQRLAFALPVSQRVRIVGGASHGLPGIVRPSPRRDLAPGGVNHTCPVASLAPLPLWSQRNSRPHPLLAVLTIWSAAMPAEPCSNRSKTSTG